MSASVAGVIVAGGRAVRMGGRDKAFAAVGGEPIAVRTIRLFHELFPQVLVATLRAGRYALRDFLGTIRVDYVGEAELRRVRGAAASLTNVNTPEELAAVGGRFEEPRG